MNMGGEQKKKAPPGTAEDLSGRDAAADPAGAEPSREAPAAHRLFGSWQWLLWVMVLILLASATAAANLHLRKSPEFSLENILVEGCEKLDPTFIRSLSGAQTGTNLLVLDTGYVSRRLERCPLIEGAAVIKQFPRSLLIRVRERQPAALALGRGAFVCLDAEGVVCDRVLSGKPPDLPLLTGLEDYPWTFGERELGRGVQAALSLMAELNRNAVLGPLSEIHVDLKKGLSFYLENLPVEVRIGWEPFTAGIRRLERVLPYLRAGSDRILSVDVRYARFVYVQEEDVTDPKLLVTRGGGQTPGDRARYAGEAQSPDHLRDAALLKAARKTSFLHGHRSGCLSGPGLLFSQPVSDRRVLRGEGGSLLAEVRVRSPESGPELFPATC